MHQASRYHKFRLRTQLTLQTDATSPEIPMEDLAVGTIFIPAGSSITTLTYFAKAKPAAETDPLQSAAQPSTELAFLPLFTAAGVAVTQTVAAGQAYDMPLSIQGCASIQIRVNAAGAVDISMKS